MKSLLVFLVTIFLISCCSAQSQSDMNENEHKNYVRTDQELNTLYQSILKEYTEDTAFIKNLKTTQKIWISFRDAEMKMKYPDREPGYYGTIQPSCWSIYLARLTQERINTLKEWEKGDEEGDACSGSVKTKE
ncbi:MAG: lysozyme inhibitor LprI family protein [Saprospiraceae bacterium]